VKGRRAAHDRRTGARGIANDGDARAKHNGWTLKDSEQRWLMNQIESHGKRMPDPMNPEQSPSQPATSRRPASRAANARHDEVHDPPPPVEATLPMARKPEAGASVDVAPAAAPLPDSFWRFG
jgi:hypothetical protein